MQRRQRHETPIRNVCALLFALFSFLYIYLLQGELLALMQDYLSRGVTQSNAFLAALIITALLMLMQWGINRVSKLHGRWEAVSYLPSSVLLALVTDIDASTMLYTLSHWIWGVLGCTASYIALVWLNRMIGGGVRKRGFVSQLWPNLATLSLLFLFVGQTGSNASVSHMELAAWNYVHAGEYDRVLEVGRRSNECNARLTALRNLSMAKTGQLGERLFHYPQPYGADGLLYNRYSRQTASYGAQEYYRHLGAQAYGGESARAFTERMYHASDSAIYRDLYLAALLLDKDLDAFAQATATMVQSGEALPVHYQEALLLYGEQHDGDVAFTADSVVAQRFADYRALTREHADDAAVAHNLVRRKFGDTYWCYYEY